MPAFGSFDHDADVEVAVGVQESHRPGPERSESDAVRRRIGPLDSCPRPHRPLAADDCGYGGEASSLVRRNGARQAKHDPNTQNRNQTPQRSIHR